MQRKQSRKLLTFLLIVGLLITLSMVVIRKRKFGIYNQTILRLSRYRDLRPYIIAQAKFETAEPNPFESKVYQRDNNLFGMKTASKRPQLGSPGTVASDGGTYQHYITDTQSLRDLFKYFDYVKFPTKVDSAEAYARELKNRSYYTADISLYTNGLKRYLV